MLPCASLVGWIAGPAQLTAQPAAAASFQAHIDADLQQTGGFKEGGAAWLDFDGDGDWDLLAPQVRGAALLRNDGNLGFTDVTDAKITELNAGAIAPIDEPTRGLLAGDLDNDGNTDIVRVQVDRVDVWFQTGGTFSSSSTADYVYVASETEGVGLLDWDLDGWLDILVPDEGPNDPQVLVNDHAGGFVPSPAIGMPSVQSDFALVIDLDFDRDIDVLLRTTPPGLDAFLFDPLVPGWVVEPSLDLTSIADDVGDTRNKGVVFACDVDRIGQHTIVWTEPAGGDTSFHRRNPVSGVFQTLVPPIVPAVEPDVEVLGGACADLDNNGWIDVALADADYDHLYTYDPVGGWTREVFGANGDDSLGIAPADADGDGDIDLYVTAIARNTLYENTLDADDPVAADAHLQVRLMAALGDCATDRILRDDIGAHAVLYDPMGRVVGGVQDVSGGGGRGSTGWPVLHWGVDDPSATYRVEVSLLRDPDAGYLPYELDVSPAALGSPHLLVVSSDDHDGDTILNVDELYDLDGDLIPSSEDLDSDGDGLLDIDEAGRTDPCAPLRNSDNDGLPDAFDPDSDNDLLGDGDEIAYGTDPTLADTDGGGRTDWEELFTDETDPLDPGDDKHDLDGDGLVPGSGPYADVDDSDADIDDDGLSDGEERVTRGTDDQDPDTDGDGILDGVEVAEVDGTADSAGFVPDADPRTATDPLAEDTDRDGLLDGVEDANHDGAIDPGETDPNEADTDGGGVDDGAEVAAGTDPLDPSDDVPAPPDPRPPADLPDVSGTVGCGCGPGVGHGGGLAWIALAAAWGGRRRRAVSRAVSNTLTG